MATKQELETEVVELKAQLADLQAPRTNPESHSSEEEIETPDGKDEATSDDTPTDDLQQLIEQAADVIEDHPSVKPLLLLAGVFGIGFLVGRSR